MLKAYLFLYNTAQAIGWSWLLFEVIRHFADGKPYQTIWPHIEFPLLVFQNAAILEVLHSLLGMVRSPVATTAIQVASRVGLTAVAYYVTSTRTSPFVSLMVFCWSVTEVIRYTFYALGQINVNPYILLFLRYTTFIILYPAGVAGELGVLYASLDEIKKTNMGLDISIPLYYITLFIMATYLPGLPYMYTHMMSQRRKALGGKDNKSSHQKQKKQN